MDTTLIADAFDGFARSLDAVGAAQWSASTPCADWDVRTLVNHVMAELLWVPSLLGGSTIAEVGDRFDGDVVGDDPRATWTAASSAALAAASEPGAQDRTVHLSFGDVPGHEYLGQVTSDVVLHSWDLARAISADDRIPLRLVEFVDGFVGPQIDLYRSVGAFGAAVDGGPDATPQARLLAQTGRSPN